MKHGGRRTSGAFETSAKRRLLLLRHSGARLLARARCAIAHLKSIPQRSLRLNGSSDAQLRIMARDFVAPRDDDLCWAQVTPARPLSWRRGAGRPGYRERPRRAHCARERGRRDGAAELPRGAHTPGPALPVVPRDDAAAGGAAGFLLAEGVRCARCDRRCAGRHCAAFRRVGRGRFHRQRLRRVGIVDAGRHHRDADDAFEAFVKGGADDDVGVRVGLFANAGRSFVDLIQRQILAAGD